MQGITEEEEKGREEEDEDRCFRMHYIQIEINNELLNVSLWNKCCHKVKREKIQESPHYFQQEVITPSNLSKIWVIGARKEKKIF